jgi:hypothetical protein
MAEWCVSACREKCIEVATGEIKILSCFKELNEVPHRIDGENNFVGAVGETEDRDDIVYNVVRRRDNDEKYLVSLSSGFWAIPS